MSDIDRKNHTVRAGRDAISAVQLPQGLTAAIDAFAEAHQINRSDAIRQLIELGLKSAPRTPRSRQQSFEIEDEAASRIREMLDPALPAEERERRIRRLIDGPPEFSEQRLDLPKHDK